MDNNRTLFDALQANVEATRKELSATIDRRNQYLQDAMLPTGDYAFNMAELAKAEAQAEQQMAAHKKAQQALEKLMADDKANGRQSSRIKAAIDNFEQSLKLGVSTEEALQSLSPEDKLVFMANPQLIASSQLKSGIRPATDVEDRESYTIEDELTSHRDGFDYIKDLASGVVDTVKTTAGMVAATSPTLQGVFGAATMQNDALKRGSDISRKIAAQQELKELAKLHPELAQHFLDTADANELTTEDYAFLNSEEGSQYRSILSNLKSAQDLTNIDTSLGLQLNQRNVDNSINTVARNFKIMGVGEAFYKSAMTLATEMPSLIVEGIRSLGPALMLSGNHASMATALTSMFASNLSDSLTELRSQGKGLDEINYAKVSALGFLAATVDAVGDRLLSTGARKVVGDFTGNLLTKQNKRYAELVDDFVAKGLTTEQASNAAMKIVAPETIGEAYKTFTQIKNYSKNVLSETVQNITGYDSKLGRALRRTGEFTGTLVGKTDSLLARTGFAPTDMAKEMIGEGLAEATGGALQNIAQDKEVTGEDFFKEALRGGAVGLGMQPAMVGTGWAQKGINKLGARKYLSDKEFSSNIKAIQNIMESTDYDNYDSVREALEKTTELKSKTEDDLKEVNSKLKDYQGAITTILDGQKLNTSLVTQSGQLISPENSGLSGSDLREYTKIYNDSEKLFAVKDKLESRQQQLNELYENLNYDKAGKGHSREFSKVEQLANLQQAEEQATSDRAKDFEALSEANKIRYMQQYEGMTEAQAKDYIGNLDTDYTAQDIINNANVGNRQIDAQKLQDNIDYYGIDANHLNQIKNANVLEALANIDDTQASVDNYNKIIKQSGLGNHKDLYRRVSSPKESANTRSEAIKKAKFSVFNKKLGNPSTVKLALDKARLQSVLDNNGKVDEKMSNLIGYINYGDSQDRDAFVNGLNATGQKIFQENANYLDNTSELKIIDKNYSQYRNRHTKLFDSQSEAKKAVGSNTFLRVKEDPYTPGKWAVKSIAQEFIDAIEANTIKDVDSLKDFITSNNANVLSKNDVKLIDNELNQGKTYEDVLKLYHSAMVNAHKSNTHQVSTRVKEAMGVLGYNAKSLKTSSFSSKIRDSRKAATQAKIQKEQETKKTEEVTTQVDSGFKGILKDKQLTDLKIKKLTKEEEKEFLETINTNFWSNLIADKHGKLTVSSTFANQIKQIASLASTEYYTKASKADKVTSQKSILMLNLESDVFKKTAMLANAIDDLITRGVIDINVSNTALQVFDNPDNKLSKHLYVAFGNNNEITTLTFEPNAHTTRDAEIRVLNQPQGYTTASTRDSATRDAVFNMLISNTRSIGNTGNMSDGGRSFNIELNNAPTNVENSLELQEDLFGIHQNATNYLHNNVIRHLDSNNTTERNNAIDQLRSTVSWFWNHLNNNTTWSVHGNPPINSFSNLDGSINNNRAYFIHKIGDPQQLRDFIELHNALTLGYNDIPNQQVVKELINNPNKFDKVFNSMNSALGVMLLRLAVPRHRNRNPSDDMGDLRFTHSQIDEIYNNCGNDPLTRNIVFNSIIWDTQLFSAMSANGTQGAAGNMGAIRRAGNYIRKTIDETKCPGNISIHVHGSANPVNTQDNFHVIERNQAGEITAAYTLTASMLVGLGYHNANVEIYTNDGQRLSNPATDLGRIHTRNAPKHGLVTQLTTLFNATNGGDVFRDFLKIDFMTNSITRNPQLNTTAILSAGNPLNINWEYISLVGGHSNRSNVMTFVTELGTIANGLQQSYTYSTFTSHEFIDTLANGKLREFTLTETRNQLNALATYIGGSGINVNGVLTNNSNIKQYYRDRQKDLEEALRKVSMWTPNNNAGGTITRDMITTFVGTINRKSKTTLTPEERLVANFLIEYGSTQRRFNNAIAPTASAHTTQFERRNAHVNNPEFLNVIDNMVSSNEELNRNFRVDTGHGGIFNIPNIMHSLASGEEFPGITDTIEVSGLGSNIAQLCIDANVELSTLLNGVETEYNKHGLLRHFMRERDGSWFLPNNIMDAGICALFAQMPSINVPQSEEFRNKISVALGKASPQARMRASLNLNNIKGTNKDEAIKQIAIHLKKSLGQFLIPKNDAVNPNIIYEELAGTILEAASRKGYLKKTLLRTDPTASDAGQIITDPSDTKGCTVFYGLAETSKAESVVSAVRNCVRFTPDGRTTHCIFDSFGMESTSRNNYTVTDNTTDITAADGNVTANTNFNTAWNNANTRTTYGREIRADDGTVVARYFEEIPNDPDNLHRWCQIYLSNDANPHWVTVPASALYSDKATNTFCTNLALQANATQYIQPQQVNIELITQIFGPDLAGFRVNSDGTVYHENVASFPCHIRLDLPPTEQPDEFYAMFGLTKTINKFREAGNSTQQAEAQEALIAHYNNILDLLRCIAGQHEAYTRSSTTRSFNDWLGRRNFHFHLKNSVNARVMYDSVLNPRDAKDIRMFFTTVRSQNRGPRASLKPAELATLENSIRRGRNLILAANFGLDWDKSVEDFLDNTMDDFYYDLVNAIQQDATMQGHYNSRTVPSTSDIEQFLNTANLSITVPTFSRSAPGNISHEVVNRFTPSVGVIQCITEICTSMSHLNGRYNENDMFYIRGEVDGITNGTAMLLGKSNRLSDAVRDDTAELWNKVGVSLTNMQLFDIKSRQVNLGVGADAYLNQLIVNDSDIHEIINQLHTEQQASGSDINPKKDVLDILGTCFEVNADLAPQLTRDLAKTQAMPYNYLAGKASRQQSLLESLCTEINHTLKVTDEATLKALLTSLIRLNNGSITLHNIVTAETKVVTIDQIATATEEQLKGFSVDFGSTANEQVLNVINDEAAARFVEAPGVKLGPIAEDAMQDLAKGMDTYASLILAEFMEEINANGGTISHTQKDAIFNKHIATFPGPGGSQNALNHQGISINKHNYKQVLEEFINTIFVPVKGGGITVKTTAGIPTSRGAGNVPMQVHMLDGTVVQDAVVRLGTRIYNLMIHDAVEGGVNTLISTAKRMNGTYGYMTLTENPWNMASSMLQHVIDNIQGSTEETHTKTNIMENAVKIHNALHPTQQPVTADFADNILTRLKAYSLESLMDKLNVIDEIEKTPNGTLAFNQYYGGTDSAWVLGQDDFEYIDSNGHAQVIRYSTANRADYFSGIKRVLIEKHRSTQQINSSAFALVRFIKQHSVRQNGVNSYPHLIYALVADPAKIGNTATADLDLTTALQGLNLRNSTELLNALHPTGGTLALKYRTWLFRNGNNPGTINAWTAYQQEYNNLSNDFNNHITNQDLSSFVSDMINSRVYGTNTVGSSNIGSNGATYDDATTVRELHNIFQQHFTATPNPIPANFAAAYGGTLAQYKLTTPADINKKIARNAQAHNLIHRKSANRNQLLAGFLSLVANYKDTDQNSAELNWVLDNIQNIFPTDVQQNVYERVVPYSKDAGITRVHIPVGEFNHAEWEAGANEAEQEAIANPIAGNVFCDPQGNLYPRNSQDYRNARASFRNMYFTNRIQDYVSAVITKNIDKINSGKPVHLVVEGNSYLGAMVASALANYSYNIGAIQNSANIKVAMLPVEGTPDKLAENWTLGILNANGGVSSTNMDDTVTILSPQGDKPDPVLESMAHFYNHRASKISGNSRSLTIPKWDIQGDSVHVGSNTAHNSGKMMSPDLTMQSIIITKSGAISKTITNDLIGAINMTDQGYIDNKNMNDIPFLDTNNMPIWGDYSTRVVSQGHAIDIDNFTIGSPIAPFTTLGLNVNTAKLIQQGILEGNDESSQKMLEKLKSSINIQEVARRLKDSMTGDSRERTQGVSVFNHSVKLGPSLVNVAFIPSAEFIAIPKRLLKNLTENPHTNEYRMGNIVINKDLYNKLFNIHKNNKYLNPNNPSAHYDLKSHINQGNQVIVVSANELGDPNDPTIQSIIQDINANNPSSFFARLQDNIKNRAYRSLDVYADRVQNNRGVTGNNNNVLVFKDTEITEGNDFISGNNTQYMGNYSRVNLNNLSSSELSEFWNSIQPVTDIRNQAHREYSSSYASEYASGATIATGNYRETLGNSIHALHDDSLQDIAQSLYGVDQLKQLFNHPALAQNSNNNHILERTISTILDTDIQVMIGIQNSFNKRNTPLAITGIDAHTGRQFVNISMQNVGSNIAENNREALAHEITHRVVAEGLKNDNLLRQVRVLYEYVKDNISEDDFQCDYATRHEIMDYVFPKHRTNVNVLQEFLAYALTNKHLIQAIANMKVDSATIEALNARTSGLFNKICAYVTDSATNHMNESSVQRGICQLFADMAKIAKKNWTKPEERLKYADASFGMDFTDIDKHPDLDATRGIPVGDKALLGAITFDYKQAQGSYDEFIRYINRDDYSEEHLGNSAYTPESIGLTRWIENCCRKFSDNLYGFMNMLVPIMGGTTKSNQIYSKAALQLKVRVDQMRERLITAGTKYVRGLFDTCEIGDDSQISQDRRRAITDTILDTDFKTLMDTYKYEDIRDMVANPKKLNQEIQKLLSYPVIQKSATYYSNACKGLANRMVHGVDTSRLGLRNAYQIFNKWGSNNATTSHYSADGVKQIDTLITLYAIQVLSPEHKERLLDLMELPKGEQLINGITTMHRQLMLKQERDIFSNDNNVYNIPKGWTHRLTDSDKSLQLIPRSSLEMYEYQGYEYVTDANVSPDIKRLFPKESDLVYVKHQHILNTPYVPGIAPTVRKHQQEGEQYTINLLGTGRLDLTIDPDLRQSEFQKAHGIHARQSKVMSTTQSTHPITEYDTLLEPIFNTMGKIIGYNLRPNDKTLAKFTKEDTEADHILGTTLGNIAERHITPQLNQKTAENLDKIYTESKHKDRDFKWIGLNDTNEEVQLAYKMLPSDIREYFQNKYPGKGVPIEKQYFARIVGHKPISAGDIKELEKYYNKAMNAPMDYIKKAFHSKYAVAGEYWAKQLADIGKQALVIQSGTVTLYNWISNLMLLTMRGVSLQDAIQLQAKGWKQLQRYKELGQQIDDLKVKALMQPKIDISSKINGLQSEIENLDIYPLLKEGFYSSIATNEITSKDTLVESTLKALPQEIRNTMGYKGIANLLAAKGTTVHKWLQDLAVDSDFVGRYALYTHLKDAQFTDPVTGHTTTMSEDKRLGIINDMFIDYTVPLPKPIEWAEKVGLYVFSKYMFRTQKNLYSIFTSNWQEVGKLYIAQMMLGSGAMGSNPFQSLMLPGQVLSHLNTPGSLALDGLSGLPLVRLLN